tara:strand:- start:101 stop:550 length:450 start_codon:yes stop_codon:yes gene_type:complete
MSLNKDWDVVGGHAVQESSNKVTYSEQIKRAKDMASDNDNIKYLEKKYPEMTSEFKNIQSEQYKLFCEKQHDYGPSNIAVGTQLATEAEIKLSLTGLWFRMNDKIQRLKNMLMNSRESAVKDEPIEDSFMDVSIYGIMAMIVKNGKWGK